MKTKTLFILAATGVLSLGNAGAVISLFERIYEIDGVDIQPNVGDAIPASVNESGFDTSTGVGTSIVTISSVGDHYVGLFLDHEIDEAINTFFNETGASSGAPAAGQSFEIDEPGFLFGDIVDNLLAESLDNTILAGPEDMSMALAHEFSLSPDETATISFRVSDVAPGGFHLIHTDPDSGESIYYSSTLRITGRPDGVPDTTGVLPLVAIIGTALAGGHLRRRLSRS